MTLYSGGDMMLDADAMGNLEGRCPGHSQVMMMQNVEDRRGDIAEGRALLDTGVLGVWALDGDE